MSSRQVTGSDLEVARERVSEDAEVGADTHSVVSEIGQINVAGVVSDQRGAVSSTILDELQCALDQATRRADANAEHALRVQAEMDNLRKRTEREVESAHKFGTERLLNELLPVLDSMELGLSAAEGNSDAETMREGMQLTLKMLRSATEKFGAEAIDPVGVAFDPDSHQAITMQDASGEPPGSVLAVVQKGYRLNGRLVRPALVVVSK